MYGIASNCTVICRHGFAFPKSMWKITFIIYDTLGYSESGICCHLHWAQVTGGESKLTEFWCPIARRIIACPIISSMIYLILARGTDLVYPCSKISLIRKPDVSSDIDLTPNKKYSKDLESSGASTVSAFGSRRHTLVIGTFLRSSSSSTDCVWAWYEAAGILMVDSRASRDEQEVWDRCVNSTRPLFPANLIIC